MTETGLWHMVRRNMYACSFDMIERAPAFKSFVMDGQVDERSTLRVSDEGVEVSIPPKRIATLMVDNASEE